MRTYSIYDAKAKLSELIRFVKKFGPVIITERNKPVVQVIPVPEPAKTLEERTKELEAAGLISKGTKPLSIIRPLYKKPGALKRFLESRD